MTEARKEARRGPRAASLIGTVTRTKEALETKEKVKGKGKSETRYCYDCGEEGHTNFAKMITDLTWCRFNFSIYCNTVMTVI